jgi:hypothetical protein
MRNVIIGILVAAAIVAAFYFGFVAEDEQDGPAEKIGESIDKNLNN